MNLTLRDMKDYDDAIATLYELRLQSTHQHAVWLKLHNAGAYCRDMSDKGYATFPVDFTIANIRYEGENVRV